MHPLRFTMLLAAAALFTLQARAADTARSYEVAPFTAISSAGAMSITIEVGKTQSITATGSDDAVSALRADVSGDELHLGLRGGSMGSHWGNVKVVVTVPALTAFRMSGAGATTITHMRGDRLAIGFSGAGSLRAEGSVRSLTMNVDGVGSIDTRELHADTAHVDVSGVGSVKVWAATTLDASVDGVGSLTYYGDPKKVDTHGGGLGSISHGR